MNHLPGPEIDDTDGPAQGTAGSVPPASPAADATGLPDEGSAPREEDTAVRSDASAPVGDVAQADAADDDGHGAHEETDATQPEADAAAAGPADPELAAGTAAPDRPATGEPRVDAALALLDRLADLPVTEHAPVFERVHAELTAVLGQLDPESAGAED